MMLKTNIESAISWAIFRVFTTNSIFLTVIFHNGLLYIRFLMVYFTLVSYIRSANPGKCCTPMSHFLVIGALAGNNFSIPFDWLLFCLDPTVRLLRWFLLLQSSLCNTINWLKTMPYFSVWMICYIPLYDIRSMTLEYPPSDNAIYLFLVLTSYCYKIQL